MTRLGLVQKCLERLGDDCLTVPLAPTFAAATVWSEKFDREAETENEEQEVEAKRVSNKQAG